MAEYTHVAVLMGGPSAEREISLRSGRAVAGGLRAAGYTVAEVDIPDRRVALPGGVEAVFIALHGEFGEDGELQQFLDAAGMPYTGSGPEASRLAFDKVLSKKVFEAHGIPSAPYEVLRGGGGRSIGLPVVVKPARQGSSIGLHLVRDEAQWKAAVADAFRYDGAVIVESYIEGREMTVGVVDGEVFPAVEIVAPDTWYDYRAKYTSGACRYVTPAPVDAALAARLRDMALRVYEALGCRGFGRVDFRVTAEGCPMVLEMNTIPGFTETSLLPKAAAAAGMGFAALCDRIMKTARTT